MKAVQVVEYGKPLEIVELDEPAVLADSLVIAVHAASVNPIDSLIRNGAMAAMLPYELPWTVGYDLSGVVVEVGADVSQFAVAEEVFGRADGMQAGTFAEFAVIKAGDLAVKPANISHVEAATIPLAGLTAWQALFEHGRLVRGQKVLIHAGSGGVGTLAIQLAKHLGAFVATTTSGPNIGMVTRLGADLVIDYSTQEFDEELSDYDLVLDMLGGDTLERSFAVLKRGGTLISIKGEAAEGLAEQHGVTFESFFMSPNGGQLAELAQMIIDGVLRPVVDAVYPLEQVEAAFEHIDAGHAKGKIALQIR